MRPSALVRTRRLLELGPWLVARGTVTVAEAAREFGVEPEVIEADVALLDAMEVPGFAEGVDYGYATAATVADGVITVEPHDSLLTGGVPLSADEAGAMLVALQALEALPGIGHEDALRTAAAKLSAALAGSGGTAEVSVDLAEPVDPGVLQPLRDALRDDRQVRLRYYVASRDELTERVVDPLRLGTQDGHWYLQAWCHEARGARQFRLENIQELTVLRSRRSRLPEDVDLAEPGAFEATSSSLTVVLELEPQGRWLTEYYPVQRVEELTAGRTRVTLVASSPEWAVSLVLRLGGAARVLSPTSVATRVAAEARRALGRYPTT